MSTLYFLSYRRWRISWATFSICIWYIHPNTWSQVIRGSTLQAVSAMYPITALQKYLAGVMVIKSLSGVCGCKRRVECESVSRMASQREANLCFRILCRVGTKPGASLKGWSPNFLAYDAVGLKNHCISDAEVLLVCICPWWLMYKISCCPGLLTSHQDLCELWASLSGNKLKNPWVAATLQCKGSWWHRYSCGELLQVQVLGEELTVLHSRSVNCSLWSNSSPLPLW